MKISSNKKKTILIVTSKEDLTSDYLIIRLKERDIPFFRLNTEELPTNLEGVALFPNGNFFIKDELGRSICSSEIVGIWYRRPKMLNQSEKIDPEILSYLKEDSWFFVNGLLDLVNDSVNWISRPEKIKRAENKLYQLKIASKIGFNTPLTFIGNSAEKLKEFLESSNSTKKKFIVKPIRNGRYFIPDGFKIFYTTPFPEEWESAEIKACPIIIQERIFKKRDIRATVIHDKIFSVGINTDGLSEEIQLDWRRGIDTVLYEPINLPDNVSKKLLQMLSEMELSFGAIDLIETVEGDYIFLEINPNGQWAWIEEKTGLPMRDSLIDTLLRGG